MLGQFRRATKRRNKPNECQPHNRKRLRMEPLEGRAMLAGVVDVQTVLPDLFLVGDGSNNQVELHQTNNPGEYHVTSPDNTLFTLNGSVATFDELTVNGITRDIVSLLDDGNDSFSFLGVAPGAQSTVPRDLYIYNADGSNVNVVSDVLVNRDLYVLKNAGSSGYSELQILDSTVVGDTYVDNIGVGTGDTKTVINNSHLQGGGAGAFALRLFNPNGDDLFDALGNSQFGNGGFVGFQPTVLINNADGGSRTTFTGANQVAGPGTTTIYGQVEIYNFNNVPGTLDIVTFNSVNVLGSVLVDNDDGDTQTVVINSTLGSDFVPPVAGTGGSFRVENDAGYDMFEMTDSLVPWGLYIDNDSSAAGASLWGSDTHIDNSTIVTNPPGSALPIAADAFRFFGDGGADVINLIETTLGGRFHGMLYNGNNSVSLLDSTMGGLDLWTGVGNDTVSIDNTWIIDYIDIFLDLGADTLSIHNEDYLTQWPNPLLSIVNIDGGLGVDTFSGVVPPNDTFANFQSFIP